MLRRGPGWDGAGTESDEEEDAVEENNEEWQTTGSPYIGKKVHIEVEVDRRKGTKEQVSHPRLAVVYAGMMLLPLFVCLCLLRKCLCTC